jgi:hypothetical protein
MVKRSESEWRLLFAEHAASGLTANRFCREHRLCPKYFSLRKKQLGWRDEKAVLVSSPSDSPFVRIERSPIVQGSQVMLRLGPCEWEFRDVSPDWLAGLMRALA